MNASRITDSITTYNDVNNQYPIIRGAITFDDFNPYLITIKAGFIVFGIKDNDYFIDNSLGYIVTEDIDLTVPNIDIDYFNIYITPQGEFKITPKGTGVVRYNPYYMPFPYQSTYEGYVMPPTWVVNYINILVGRIFIDREARQIKGVIVCEDAYWAKRTNGDSEFV
jgi:hypothetical protein